LRIALNSIAPQAAKAGAELIVVDDAGASEEARALAERFGALYLPHPGPLGLNVARNSGFERSTGELVVFVDDDVEVCEGWLDALLDAACAHPSIEVFTGPILPRLEGSPPHSCGREGAPITSLDLGSTDTPTPFAWGANMTIRRSALERIGPFDVSLEHGGDEQEWQERLLADRLGASQGEAGRGDGPPGDAPPDDDPRGDDATRGLALYVAAARLHHRRAPADVRLRPLCLAAFARGRAARRFDAWRGATPSLGRELATLAGCFGHVARYRCPAGLTMVAHSLGRLREALLTGPSPRARGGVKTLLTGPSPRARGGVAITTTSATDPRRLDQTKPSDDFLSGESGTIGGLDGLRRWTFDVGADALRIASGTRARLDRAARDSPARRRLLALCLARPEHRLLVGAIRAELACSRHIVAFHNRDPDGLGKFENLNLLLAEHPAEDYDWLLIVDDDIELPRGFLDRFLFLAERFGLDLAQPAHQLASHAAWRVTRRHPACVLRETRFIEIGPVTAFRKTTFSTLLPFPALRMGWGLDLHWAALAGEQHWRCGVIDATPIVHRAAPAARDYSREQALEEARSFLADRPYLTAIEAQQTLVCHRRW
jgi:hypothetical protein